MKFYCYKCGRELHKQDFSEITSYPKRYMSFCCAYSLIIEENEYNELVV